MHVAATAHRVRPSPPRGHRVGMPGSGPVATLLWHASHGMVLAAGSHAKLEQACTLRNSGSSAKWPASTGSGGSRRGGWNLREAEHPVLGRRAAVKVLHENRSLDDIAVKRFIAEAKPPARSTTRTSSAFSSFGTLPNGRLFYVMDLLDGVPLITCASTAACPSAHSHCCVRSRSARRSSFGRRDPSRRQAGEHLPRVGVERRGRAQAARLRSDRCREIAHPQPATY